MSTQNLPFPVALLARINREAKKIEKDNCLKMSIWQALDDFIPVAKTSVDIDWPDSVFMPFGLWPSFLERYYGFPTGSIDLDQPITRGMAQALSCLAPWRATQDIVRFDPEMEDELKGMNLAGKLPTDILLRLPAWGIFIDAKLTVDNDQYQGFFVQLDAHHKGLYLALTFQGAGNIQQRVPIALGDYTLAESLAEVERYAFTAKETVKHNDHGLIQALNMVIYLCAYGLQDRQDYGSTKITYPKAKKVKKGWRITPPDRPKMHVLGASFGESIRKESVGGKESVGSRGGTGAKRPHIRRPHWHHFWKGPVAERQLIVRWLPPIFVGNFEREEENGVQS